jgi:Glycosyltransferase sugar-binding region containing DXD motif
MIPKRLIRVVPQQTSREAENFWDKACDIHKGWAHVTRRDPLAAKLFPNTSHLWPTCESGAQLADLVRAEELYWAGGVYIDSDVEVYRSFEPLLKLRGFAAWEDSEHIPNAVMGFEAKHPAIYRVMERAAQWHHLGTWQAGVGVTTEVFRDRTDMLVLPPGSFYPYHYRDKACYLSDGMRRQLRRSVPWAFCAHHWAHSWA